MIRTRVGCAVVALPVLLVGMVGCGNPSGSEPTVSAQPGAHLERLLPAVELPGLNDEWGWQETTTESTPREPIGICATSDPLSIGASSGLTRTYAEQGAASSDAAASMTVLEFPDSGAAQRASDVVASWHDSCAQRTNARVEPTRDVKSSADHASWYLVITTEPGSDDGHFQTVGMATAGSRMALLTIDHDGQDHNYEPGRDPMQLAVALAATRLR